MDPNAGRFTTDEAEIALRALSHRLGPGEIVEIKGIRFIVNEIGNVDGRGEVRLRMLSREDRALLQGGGFAVPEIEPRRNRHERRALAAERRRATR